MKKYLYLLLSVTLSLIICPLGVYTVSGMSSGKAPYNKEESLSESEIIKVFRADTGNVEEMNFRDYIIGVVAAEMPAEFHSEALSALAVSASTLARKNFLEGEDNSLSGAVISTDPAIHQAYMTKDEMEEKWGKDFGKYYEKIAEAVDKSIGYSVTYEGELITAAYHAMSTGITESAENVWSGEIPYLTEVKSEGDRLSPRYETTASVSNEEFIRIMSEEGADFSDSDKIHIKDALYTKAGTLRSVTIGKRTFSGEKLRQLFNLRSPAIEISTDEKEVTFTVRGYGHGVGLSQYGADYYAKQGMTWEEIIKHYYKGVDIEKADTFT